MQSDSTAISAPLPHDDSGGVNHIPPIPEHWVFKGGRHLTFIYGLFCVIGTGHTSLHPIWKIVHPKCATEDWNEARDSMKTRFEHINILAGLLLAAETAFCTTDPPAGGRFLPYTEGVAYCFILGATLGTLLCIWVGSTTVFVLHEIKPRWFREIMMGSRLRIWLTTITLALPSLCITCSAGTLTIGLTIAAAYSEFIYIKIIPYFVVASACFATLLFIWMTISGHKVRPPHKAALA